MDEETFFVSTTNWNRVKILGKGSYGMVFLAAAVTEPLNFAALKVVPFECSSSLMTEKNILKNFIGCPEIVQCIESEICFDDDSFDSISYNLVLEYAAGGTLADLITQRGKLPESEVKKYLKMILRGLSCIHSRGFVHGDLKPTNILVFPENDGKKQLKIADFGLSKRCNDNDNNESVPCNVKPKFRGTPSYMSPEYVLFGKIGTSLDIWSLGCILIEMVSGKSVWGECKNREQLMKKLVYEMEMPDIPEELSREGRDFLANCLDQNSKRRWTAKMLLEHPYLTEEHEVLDETLLIWNLPESLEIEFGELFEEEKDLQESCFGPLPFGDGLPEDLYFSQEIKKAPKKDEEMPLVLTPDDEIFQIADLIGFQDFLL